LSAVVIDGKAMAKAVQDEVAAETARLRARGLVPGLAVVLVGEDAASQVYVNSKERIARELGMYSEQVHLPSTASQAELEAVVDRLNADPRVHGILVQDPLPKQMNSQAIFRRILPAKDVDGFHPENVGRLWIGQETLAPCTPVGIMVMLERMGVDLTGKHAVVVGRSTIVGKPMAALLLAQNATVTICHSRTADLAAVCRQADILVVAIGRLQMLGADHVKPGAIVLDVGINPVPGYKTRIRGDVDFEPAAEVAGMITPVPGGVGPMTIAMLMSNTLKAAKSHWKSAV